MSKQMRLWQMIVGCVLAVFIIVSGFLPRFYFSAEKFASKMVDYLAENLSGINGLGQSLGAWSEEAWKEQKEELREEIEDSMDGVVFSASSFQLMFSGEDALKSSIDDSEVLDELGVDEISISGLMLVRILLFLAYFLPIGLIAIYVLSYVNHWSNKLPCIVTWVYILIGIIAQVVCAIKLTLGFLVAIMDEMTGGLAGDLYSFGAGMTSSSSMTGKVGRLAASIVGLFMGTGIYLLSALLFLMLVWTILLLVLYKRSAFVPAYADNASLAGAAMGNAPKFDTQTGQPIQYGQPIDHDQLAGYDQPVGYGQSVGHDQLMNDGGQEQYAAAFAPEAGENVTQLLEPGRPGNGMAVTGTLRGIAGTLAGAEITISAGEQIIIGRDAGEAQLILNHPQVSRKHCLIQMEDTGAAYLVHCFSRNGVSVSDGRAVTEGATMSVPRGSRILLGGGGEVIELG